MAASGASIYGQVCSTVLCRVKTQVSTIDSERFLLPQLTRGGRSVNFSTCASPSDALSCQEEERVPVSFGRRVAVVVRVVFLVAPDAPQVARSHQYACEEW